MSPQLPLRSPATFRVLRETLGIQRGDLAQDLGVNIKSVKAWDTHNTAPDDAWDILNTQKAWILESYDQISAGLEETERLHGSTPETLDLYAFRDDEQAMRNVGMRSRWHRAALGIIALFLEADGYTVAIREYGKED